MKRVTLLILVFLMAFAVSCNQNRNQNSQQDFGNGGDRGPGNFNPESFAEEQVETMSEMLELSSEQADQMHEIMMDGFESMRQMGEDLQQNGGGMEGMREKMMELREKQDEKIKSILSDDQWQKYEEYQEEMRNRWQQGGGFGGQR